MLDRDPKTNGPKNPGPKQNRAEEARAQQKRNPAPNNPAQKGDEGWVDDDAWPHCMACPTIFNATTKRRHHCRGCGILVCATCTTKRADFLADGSKGNGITTMFGESGVEPSQKVICDVGSLVKTF